MLFYGFYINYNNHYLTFILPSRVFHQVGLTHLFDMMSGSLLKSVVATEYCFHD